MKISYKTKKIERVCTNAKISDRTYEKDMSEKIQQRIGEIEAADTVEDMIQYHIGRCHALTNNRNGNVQLTPDVAVRLEMVLGVPAKFWNNLEAVYREKLIKVAAENVMDADEEFCCRLKEILSSCGVALVFLPHLKGAFLQGASFIEGNKIVLGLTVRGKDADSWSRDNLIPSELFEAFKRQKSFSADVVKQFANSIGVAPGIVVGRLQNEGCFKQKISP